MVKQRKNRVYVVLTQDFKVVILPLLLSIYGTHAQVCRFYIHFANLNLRIVVRSRGVKQKLLFSCFDCTFFLGCCATRNACGKAKAASPIRQMSRSSY